MISLLVTILVLALIFGLVWWAIGMIPLPPPFGMIVQVALVLIFVLVLLSYLLPLAGSHAWLR
jgi:uncharacterized membrane protein YwzB